MRMTRTTLLLVFLATASSLPAMKLGLRFSFGGRYDNVRMCVATPAGTPGGPAADAALLFLFRSPSWGSLEFVLPVFRPLFFLTRFDMLQTEPEVTWIPRPDAKWSLGIGLGITLHYGPDYKSDNSSNRGPDFFALGPKFSFLLQWNHAGIFTGRRNSLGLRPYVTPLFSRDYRTGIVLGANLEYSLQL